MKARIALFVALSVFGCKKKKQEPAPTPASGTAQVASGSGPGTAAAPEEPKSRPSQAQQATLPALELPDDPKRKEKIALGHVLFFDKRLSGANDRACYSCHLNEDGTGGHDPLAIGSGDKTLTRHSPVIWNVGYWKNAFYWDGRAPTLEDNVKGAWGGPNMNAGKDNLDKKAAELGKVKGYKKL